MPLAADAPGLNYGWNVNVLSFGEDAAGELYVLSRNGTVYRLVEGGSG